MSGQSEAGEESLSLLIFRAGGAWFGVEATTAVEVSELFVPTPLPRMPAHVPGLMVLRSRALPILDLGAFLGLAPGRGEAEAADPGNDPTSHRAVVVEAAGMEVAIISTKVRGVFQVPIDTLKPPEALGDRVRPFAQAQADIEMGLVAVLDLPALLKAAKPQAGDDP